MKPNLDAGDYAAVTVQARNAAFNALRYDPYWLFNPMRATDDVFVSSSQGSAALREFVEERMLQHVLIYDIARTEYITLDWRLTSLDWNVAWYSGYQIETYRYIGTIYAMYTLVHGLGCVVVLEDAH